MAALFKRSRRDTFKLELGRKGFDNRVVYELNKIGFEIYNDPHFIKTYHTHNSSANPVRSWRFELISYPPPYQFIGIPDYGFDKSAKQSEQMFQTLSGTFSVALCLIGQLRTFHHGATNIMNNIVKPNNADVFLSISDDSLKFQKLVLNEDKMLRRSIMANANSIFGYHLKSYVFMSDELTFDDHLVSSNTDKCAVAINLRPETDHKRLFKKKPFLFAEQSYQFFCLRIAMRQIVAFETENNLTYSAIIKSRFDLQLRFPISILEHLFPVSPASNSSVIDIIRLQDFKSLPDTTRLSRLVQVVFGNMSWLGNAWLQLPYCVSTLTDSVHELDVFGEDGRKKLMGSCALGGVYNMNSHSLRAVANMATFDEVKVAAKNVFFAMHDYLWYSNRKIADIVSEISSSYCDVIPDVPLGVTPEAILFSRLQQHNTVFPFMLPFGDSYVTGKEESLLDEALVWVSPRPWQNTTAPIFPSLDFDATKVDSAHRAQILKDIENWYICYSFDDNTPSCSGIVKGTPLPPVELERGLFHSGEAWLSEKKSDARKHAAVSTVFYIEE